jgi:hypothetical protein
VEDAPLLARLEALREKDPQILLEATDQVQNESAS